MQWEEITITAKIKKTRFVGCRLKTEVENKVILNNLKGIARPHTFTVKKKILINNNIIFINI